MKRVEGRPNLIRNDKGHIIVRDPKGLEMARLRKSKREEDVERLNTIESDLADIKILLTALLEKKEQ